MYAPAVVAEFQNSVQNLRQDETIRNQAVQVIETSGISPTDTDFDGLVQQQIETLAIENSANLLVPFTMPTFQPESVQSVELGYKSLISKNICVDGYFYRNAYKNFETTQALRQSTNSEISGLLSPNTSKTYQVYANIPNQVRSWGWALGVDWALPKNYVIGANISSNQIQSENTNESTQLQFNTPPYRVVLKCSNRELTKRVGFQMAWRWQDAFLWESTFGVGDVDAYSTLDAQVSYNLPKTKTLIKFGGSNILNQYYVQTFGNPSVGALWYVALNFQ